MQKKQMTKMASKPAISPQNRPTERPLNEKNIYPHENVINEKSAKRNVEGIGISENTGLRNEEMFENVNDHLRRNILHNDNVSLRK